MDDFPGGAGSQQKDKNKKDKNQPQSRQRGK